MKAHKHACVRHVRMYSPFSRVVYHQRSALGHGVWLGPFILIASDKDPKNSRHPHPLMIVMLSKSGHGALAIVLQTSENWLLYSLAWGSRQ